MHPGPRDRILAFDVDPAEFAELLARLRRIERVDVIEEDSPHCALERLVVRRIDLLLLDARRTQRAVLECLLRCAAPAAAARGASWPRIVVARDSLAGFHAQLDEWIDAHLESSAGPSGHGTN